MKKLFLSGLLLSSGALLRADFTYQETTQMTGGSMMAMMSALGPLAGRMREPIVSTHIIKGNRMATITKDRVTVVDLDKETITTIDHAQKTYSVMTFAEMKQRMEEAAQRMQSRRRNKNGDDVQTNVQVSAKATGQTKTVQGLSAKEMLITMTMEGTNEKTGESGAMDMSTDGWYAPLPGYQEVREFHKKMAVKLGATFGSGMQQIAQMGMGRADLGKGMEEVAKEMSKIDGVPVESVIKMGASGSSPQGSGDCTADSSQQQQGSSGAGGLAGRLGGFGGLGRRKKSEESSDAPKGQAGCSASGTLMEMTMTLTGFSAAAADASKFEVPAGYRQVEPRGR